MLTGSCSQRATCKATARAVNPLLSGVVGVITRSTTCRPQARNANAPTLGVHVATPRTSAYRNHRNGKHADRTDAGVSRRFGGAISGVVVAAAPASAVGLKGPATSTTLPCADRWHAVSSESAAYGHPNRPKRRRL